MFIRCDKNFRQQTLKTINKNLCIIYIFYEKCDDIVYITVYLLEKFAGGPYLSTYSECC